MGVETIDDLISALWEISDACFDVWADEDNQINEPMDFIILMANPHKSLIGLVEEFKSNMEENP